MDVHLLPNCTHTLWYLSLRSEGQIADLTFTLEKDSYLEQVKVYERDPTGVDPIYTKEVRENHFYTIVPHIIPTYIMVCKSIGNYFYSHCPILCSYMGLIGTTKENFRNVLYRPNIEVVIR
jgi:hypothetical protein